MFTTTVNREKLIEILEANRDAHHDIYVRAFEKYRESVLAVTARQMDEFQQGKIARIWVNAPVPEDHTEDYNSVLGLLSMSEEQSVELNADDFRQFCLDDWQWKKQWMASTNSYVEG